MTRPMSVWNMAATVLAATAATVAVAQAPDAQGALAVPAPATHQEVMVPTSDPAVTLAGTLSIPTASDRRVVVVFLTGSGDHTRDQVISGTPMFAQMADVLLAAGYGTLRLDDRGTGESTGPTTRESTTGDRIADMRAVISYLAAGDAAADGLILLGHSEGAMMAAAVAAGQPEVNALVLLGAPARSGAAVWIDQQVASAAQHLGRDAAELTEIRGHFERVVALAVAGAGEAELEEAAIALFQATELDLQEARASGMLAGFVAHVGMPWFRYFLAHDPVDDYRRVTVPVLAVYGSIDRLTSVALNADPLRRALEAAGNTDVTLEVLTDQDHFFLRADHLPPGEHRFREMHVAPELLDTIVGWLRPRF
jgi:uncharacterized protein